MVLSQNGWPASPNPADIDITPMKVGDAYFEPGVRGGAAFRVLQYVATQLHNRVEKAVQIHGCWGYNYRYIPGSPDMSNHGSGTAIDYNATLHPWQTEPLATWTQAQIDEIHKILDEVNGVVRWGGDYQYSHDSMHFEINVPPAQLDPNMTLPPNGLVGTAGVRDQNALGGVPYEKAPVLTEMSVGYPTLNSYANPATWQFTATQTAEISIDGLLSHFADPKIDAQVPGGPNVTVYLYGLDFDPVSGEYSINYLYSSGGYGGGFDPLYPDDRNQGQIRYTVEAGKTYIIQLSADNQNYPWVNQVPRIGDYMLPTDWIQPPDLEYIFATGQGDGNYEPTTSQLGVAVSAGDQLEFNSPIFKMAVGFKGQLTLSHAFAGNYPGEDPDARNCGWSWTRRLSDGGFMWSLNNAASWNGTDPYDPSIPGYGTCPILDNHEYDSSANYGDYPVGYDYTSESPSGVIGGGYSNMYYRCFCTSELFYPNQIPTEMHRHGMGYNQSGYNFNDTEYQPYNLPYFDNPDLNYGRVEWESADCELYDVKVAFDERQGGGTHFAGMGGPIVKWYVGAAKTINDPNVSGHWGPRINQYKDEWIGVPIDTPENWAASQLELGSYTGGLSTWQYLPPQYWAKEYWPQLPNGVRFAALPSGIFDTSPPSVGGDPNGVGLYLANYREWQYVAIKAVVRPSRYRVYPPAKMPDITWAGQRAIDVSPQDSGRVLY